MGSVFRKRGTTNTGTQATRLSDPNLTGASFSREGVVSQAGLFEGAGEAAGLSGIAQAASGAGATALDLDKRLALMKLEEKVQEQAIDPFLESREPGFAEEQVRREQEASFDSFILDKTADALRTTEGEGAAIERLAPDYAAVTKRLKNAERRGAMTTEELQLRMKSLTREAIAKRPGLMAELTAHARNVLNLSGAQEEADLFAQMQGSMDKQEAENRKAVIADLRKMFVPHDPNQDTQTLLDMRNRVFKKRNAFESIKNDQEIRELVENSTSDEIVNSGLPQQVIIGGYDTKNTELISLFDGVDNPKAYREAVIQAQGVLRDFEATIDTNPGFRKIANRTEMKKLRDDWVNNLRSDVESLQSFATGEEAVDFLQNKLAGVRSADELSVYSGFSPAHANVLSKVAPIVGPLAMNDASIRNPFVDFATKVSEKTLRSGSLEHGYQQTVNPGKSNFAELLGWDRGISQMIASPEDTPEQARRKTPEEYSNMFDTVFQKLETETNVPKKNAVIRDIVKEMANPNVRDYYQNIPEETQSQIFSLMDQQTQVVTNSVDDVFQKAQQEDIPLRTRFLPDGTMVFESSDGSKRARDFVNRENRRVATAHKEVIRAFSNIFGKSVPETSQMLKKVFSPQAGAVPGMTDRQSLFDALEGLEQDIQQTREEKTLSNVDSNITDQFINKVVSIESGGDPEAQPDTSKALGLGQFIPRTWINMINKYSPELATGKSKEEILEMRKDPELSKEMIVNLAEENSKVLRASGIDTNESNLYLAHFLGASAAREVLSSSPDTPISDVVGQAAIKANKSVLEGKKVKDVIEWARSKVGGV